MLSVNTPLMPREFWRQVKASFICHHSGTGSDVVRKSMTSSRPDTSFRFEAKMKEGTSWFEPVLAAQANVRLGVPPSPRQLLHARFTPAAEANDAVRSMAATTLIPSSLRFMRLNL